MWRLNLLSLQRIHKKVEQGDLLKLQDNTKKDKKKEMQTQTTGKWKLQCEEFQ